MVVDVLVKTYNQTSTTFLIKLLLYSPHQTADYQQYFFVR